MSDQHNDAPNFDISGLLGGAFNIMQGVKGVADNSRKTLAGFFEAASAINRSAKAMEQLVGRMTKMLDDIEGPIRALTPEIERATDRARRVSEALEGPVESLVSGLESAVANFDRMALSGLPDTMDAMGRQLSSFLELLGELPKRFAPFFPMAGRRFGATTSVAPPAAPVPTTTAVTRPVPAAPAPPRVTTAGKSVPGPSSKLSQTRTATKATTPKRAAATNRAVAGRSGAAGKKTGAAQRARPA